MLSFHHPALAMPSSQGLPKPAILTHERVLQMSKMLSLFGATADDVVYMVLPLYHAMGLVVGILGCLELGKPTSEDLSNLQDHWSKCQGGAVKAKRRRRLPSTLRSHFREGTPTNEYQGPMDKSLDAHTLPNGCALVRR